VALPTFTAAHRAAALSCCGVGRAAINRCLLPTRLTAANPLHATTTGKWDRQMDGWTDTIALQRYCSAYYAGNANTRNKDTNN